MTLVRISSLIVAVLFFSEALASAAEKFVLTGSPGAGKSTIIEELKKQGYDTFPEAFHTKYEQAKEEGRADVLFKDAESVQAFQNTLVEQQLQWESTLKPGTQPAFFDRGTVDALRFFKIYNSKMTDENSKGCNENQYDAAFFIEALPEKYYQQTEFRRETYAEAQEVGKVLLEEYQNEKNGLRIISVPSVDANNRVLSVEERTQMILQHIQEMHGLKETPSPF